MLHYVVADTLHTTYGNGDQIECPIYEGVLGYRKAGAFELLNKLG